MTTKRYRLGTHRILDPEETWERVSTLLPRVGISRVADVTRLDRVGIPVWQAVRPASRNLCVSQGKAVTAAGARVSAVMEAIELWHAECLDHLPQAKLSLREMQSANPIATRELFWRADSRLFDAAPLAWVRCTALAEHDDAWLPRSMIELDFTVPEAFRPQMFHLTSNGLASGNSREEALLHGLCELVERHAVHLVDEDPKRAVALRDDALDDGFCRDLVGAVRDAGLKLAIWDVTWEVGVPVILVDLVGPEHSHVWHGSGCHPAPEVAFSRALTEAVQTRLTYISGARDDLTELVADEPAATAFEAFVEPPARRTLAELPELATTSVADDVEQVVERLARRGYRVWAVDLSHDDVGVPVARAFVPGLREAFHARGRSRRAG